MKQLGAFMNKTFSGRLNEKKIAPIRDKWKGKIVLKGVATEEDTEMAIKLGLDGIIVSTMEAGSWMQDNQRSNHWSRS
jgi:L-lactate dehydrogenase (cytochrome)